MDHEVIPEGGLQARKKRTDLFTAPVREVCTGRPSPLKPTTPFTNPDPESQDALSAWQSSGPKYTRKELIAMYVESKQAVMNARAEIEQLREVKKQLRERLEQ